MIHPSSLMSKFLNLILYLILILKAISAVIFTYYFLLTKTMTTIHEQIFHTNIDEKIERLQNIYDNLNTVLGLAVAIICVILFNPFYMIDYKIDEKIKHMLYYYGLVVIYDSVFRFFTKNRIFHKMIQPHSLSSSTTRTSFPETGILNN